MDTPIGARPASAPPRTGDAAASTATPASSDTQPTKNAKGSNPSAASDTTSSSSPSGSRKSKSGTFKGSSSPLRRSRPQEKKGDGADNTTTSDSSPSIPTAIVGLGVSTGTAANDTPVRAQGTPQPSTSKGSDSERSFKSPGRKEKQTPVSEPSPLVGLEGAVRENGVTKSATGKAPAQAVTSETSDTVKAAATPPSSSPSVAPAKASTEDAETDSKKSQKLASARSQRASAKARKGQQPGTPTGTSEQKARTDSDSPAPREPLVDTSSEATPPIGNGTASPSADDMAGSAASKKRKDKRKPTKRGGAPAPGGGDEAADAPSSVETSTPSETQSTRPQPAPKPRSALSMATKVGAGGEETAGKSASEPPTKRNVPAAASPSTGGDTSDASGVQQTTSPRPGKGGKATTKGPRPQREKPERSPLQTTSGAAASAAATEDKLDGSAVDTTTERRPARSTPRSSAKESSVSSSTSSAKDTSATALDVTADSASSKTTSLPNERPVRERGTRTTLRQQRIEESASSKMTAREKPTYGERGQRQPPQYQQGDSQQGGPNTDITGDGVSDRSARSTRGAGVGAGSSLSRVFGAAKNGQSSLDARAARQEALRRERELRRQQHTQEDTTPDGETKHPEADESSTVATTRAKDPSTRPSRPEGGSYRRPSTAEYTRGEEGPGAGERDKNDSTTSSTLAADRKGADGHGSWREVKAPGAASSRFGSTQRPPRPERKEGFGTGSKVWKDGFFANSMICYMTWEEMKLRPDVIESIHRYGLKHPSNVQKLALVPFAEGKDIIAQAQSQNDRTNTFAIGALQRLKKNVKRCQAVVICSDRVQPQQVFKDLERWFEGTGLRCVMLNDTSNEELQKLYGPAATTAEAAAATTETRQPPQVAVTTLGRLAEVMDQGLLELNTIDTIGICMAQHELIDFEAFKKLWPKLSRKAQVVMMTGIMLPRLRSIKVQNFRQNTVVLRADELTLKWSEHYVIRLESQDQRWPTLVDIFQKNKTITHTVIVTSSNSVTQLLVSRLKELGMPAHGIWSMADKVQMAELFNKPDDCVLVVESALTAELDLDHDSLVINYEMPWRASHYISIFGLFGRSGLRTMMVNLLLNNKPEESAMLEELENLYDIKIAEMKLA